MTKTNIIIQQPARRMGAVLPRTLAIGPAVLELTAERTPNGGSHSRRFAGRWSKGTFEGDATIDLRPATKTTTEIEVRLGRPSGGLGVFWIGPGLTRLARLFAQGLKYEVETRSIEETDAFMVRRTSPELVRARSA